MLQGKKLDTDYLLFDDERGMKKFILSPADEVKFHNPQEGQELSFEVSEAVTRNDLLRDAALACALYVKQDKKAEAAAAFAYAWTKLGLDGGAELQKARH